jgi:glycerol transport system ATP-binding protein
VAAIELRDLTFGYPGSDEDTLSGLHLEVARGEAHALLGGSGAGKTTLLNLLSGLLSVAPGRIFFDDQDVGQVAPWDRRVTQVFQFPVLYEAMSVAENLSFPVRHLGRQDRRDRIHEIATRLGIDDVLDRRPAALTLVQKQLAAIGKSLVRPDVSLVLLDEPLTAAEPESKWQLRQTLKSLQREMGATMIYVTHDQTEALTFADRVSVLHDGRILQTATPQTLLEEPAHEHVGYFVGSPGMNLLDGEIRDGRLLVNDVPVSQTHGEDGPCRVGFRPEWATIGLGTHADGLPVTIRSTRTLTTRRQLELGLVTAELEGQEIVTRQPLDAVGEGDGTLRIDQDRVVCFREGKRLAGA